MAGRFFSAGAGCAVSNQHLVRGRYRREVDRRHGAVVIYGATWGSHRSYGRWVAITLAIAGDRRRAVSVVVRLDETRP